MKSTPAALLLLTLSLVDLRAALAEDSVRTMRVDFYHSGNRDMEMFSLDEVLLEPLPWPGNVLQPIDTTLRGKYLFEVRDSESGQVLWSRSFSSIYGEWETTAEARQLNRTFHESLRFPAPARPFQVSVSKRNADNGFDLAWQIELDPDDYLVRREPAAYADDVVAIEYNGDPAEKVDLLLLGDGFTAAERDVFLEKARELTAIFLSTT
ncbi:MAG: peptidase M64 N-terminal domain-containing protein, partial [Woeseiaceae bacterium]